MTGTFYIDGVDIATLGAVAILGNEACPLTGMFDLPRRKGETERDWGTSIEAFVDAGDIEMDGRTLTLTLLVKGDTYAIYLYRLNRLKAACVACKVLGTPFGGFNVIQKDDIGVTEYPWANMGIVTARFYEDTVTIPSLTLKPSGGSGILLDGFNLWRDLGIGVSEIKDCRNTGKRIEVNTTATYKRTNYRDKPTVTLSCFMRDKDLAGLYGRMGQLHALCVKSGLRVLTLEDGTRMDLYIKDGITARTGHETVLTFDLKLRVV